MYFTASIITFSFSYNSSYLIIIEPLILACGSYLILNVQRVSKHIVNCLDDEDSDNNKTTIKDDQLGNLQDTEKRVIHMRF